MKIKNKVREIVTILGKQGSGKTHLTINQIIPNLPKPVIIADTMAEYSRCGVNFSSVESLARYIVQGFPNDTGVYVVEIRDHKNEQAFLKFADQIKESCSIVFEEASKFCNPKSIPKEINDLIHYGRHYAINLVFTARRAAELHRSVTSQSTAIISFQQTEPNDITILKKVFHEAKDLPGLRYNPTDPASNEYMILGSTNLCPE